VVTHMQHPLLTGINQSFIFLTKDSHKANTKNSILPDAHQSAICGSVRAAPVRRILWVCCHGYPCSFRICLCRIQAKASVH
jgi:hypothetical protein